MARVSYSTPLVNFASSTRFMYLRKKEQQKIVQVHNMSFRKANLLCSEIKHLGFTFDKPLAFFFYS